MSKLNKEIGSMSYSFNIDTAVSIPVDRYNELIDKEQQLLLYRIRTLYAIKAIYRLTGISDFNEIQRMLDEEDDAFYNGIPIPISEEDKDWMIPLAHSKNISLGDWVRDIFFDSIKELRPTSKGD